MTLSVGLYIHIPFCERKCPYCDFNSYAGLDALHGPYIEALINEMAWLAQRGEWQANTMFVGGGTPTLLPLSLAARALDAAQASFSIPPGAEMTVEANPGTVDQAYLAGLRSAGVNRLSLGAQSFHDDELRLLGRLHTATEVEVALCATRKASFDNVNLDLIYGLPKQSLGRWRATLERALSLSPEHLSLYSLTVESGTPLAEWVARGDLPTPDDDLTAEMYELAEELLAQAGYFHYEISNWAGETTLGPQLTTQNSRRACRHNLVYWRNEPYLGLGAGAHASWGGRRWHNLLSPLDYVTRMTPQSSGEAPWQSPVVAGVEVVDEALAMGETMMLGLRLLEEGVPLARFSARFGRSLHNVYPAQLAALQAEGLLEQQADRVRLTPRGRLLGNQAFSRFLPDT